MKYANIFVNILILVLAFAPPIKAQQAQSCDVSLPIDITEVIVVISTLSFSYSTLSYMRAKGGKKH